METLTLTTCMAPNMDRLCRDLADYLAVRLSVPVRAELDPPWQERERLFDTGQIDLCWICGLPYVRKSDRAPGRITPLVAPVMAGSRYGDRPVYFSDVVVRSDSPFQRLSDLAGASWAYNEPDSHSGYGVVRYALALQGKTLDFFSRVVESGAHQNSLELILSGAVNASAIDSTVLELELRHRPDLAAQIRIIDTFGPSPIPPWVAADRVSPELRQALRAVLTGMDADPQGLEILQQVGMTRMAAVEDADYDPIREMTRVAFREEPSTD